MTFPDISLYQPICSVFNISISELLNGEDLTPESQEEETNKLIVRLMFTKKQLFMLKFLLSLIFGIGIGLVTYSISFLTTLDTLQKVGFIGSGLILLVTVTLIRMIVIDKLLLK